MEPKLLSWFIMICGAAIVFMLAKLLNRLSDLTSRLSDLTILMIDLKKHITGDADDPESVMIKPSVKELIANRCLSIEQEIARLSCAVFGERSRGKDGINILDTLVDIKAEISDKAK